MSIPVLHISNAIGSSIALVAERLGCGKALAAVTTAADALDIY